VKKQLATDGTEEDWISLMGKALRMDDLIRQHAAIMDRYDPAKKVALIVDEWGTWHLVEPGTQPGLPLPAEHAARRLVAGVTLHIFNQHCRPREDGQHRPDRERAAGHGAHRQGEDAAHADLPRLRDVHRPPGRHLAALRAGHARLRARHQPMPALSVLRLAREADGKVHVTLCNLNPNEAVDLKATLPARRPSPWPAAC
jgi:alpha-N-arabinofuranosidase